MTKVIIIEDESLAAQKLSRQLKNIDTEIEVVEVVDSVAGAIQFLNSHAVDLIFLDIHLGDDLSFNIFKKVEVKTPIIFTTAYDQYAIRAFKLNSLDYLLKPIGKTDLEAAINKFYEHRPKDPEIDYKALLSSFRDGTPADYQTRFMVYKGDKVRSINVEEIAYFFAEGKYVYLVTCDDQEYLVDYTLDRLQGKLDSKYFYRINRQFIIRIDAIAEMIAYTKGRLKIVLEPLPKKETIVSTERSSDFKRWLNQ